MNKDQVNAVIKERSVRYSPVATHALGADVNVGVYFSQLWYYAQMPTSQARNGWFYKVFSEIAEETCLSRKEQETARGKLKSLGVLECELRGTGTGRLWFRINEDVLSRLISVYLNAKSSGFDAPQTESECAPADTPCAPADTPCAPADTYLKTSLKTSLKKEPCDASPRDDDSKEPDGKRSITGVGAFIDAFKCHLDRKPDIPGQYLKKLTDRFNDHRDDFDRSLRNFFLDPWAEQNGFSVATYCTQPIDRWLVDRKAPYEPPASPLPPMTTEELAALGRNPDGSEMAYEPAVLDDEEAAEFAEMLAMAGRDR